MARRSQSRLLAVACAVAGMVTVYWLVYEDKAPVSVSSEQVPSAMHSTPKGGADERSDSARTDFRAEPRVMAAPAAEKVQPSIAPPLHLVFQAPSNVRVGDNFDVRVMIAGQQSLGSIAVEVAYDPTLLRVRTSEEIDSVLRRCTAC